MIIYGLKNCDTTRKAARALGVGEVRDVRENPLDSSEIARFLGEFGEDLVNRKSTTWRGLDDAARTRPPADLLAEFPALMKRPLIDADGKLFLGWGEETRKALL